MPSEDSTQAEKIKLARPDGPPAGANVGRTGADRHEKSRWVPDGLADDLGTGPGAELGHDVRDVRLHRVP